MVDGIFTNRWAGSVHAVIANLAGRNFHDFSGLDLPRTSNPQDPSHGNHRLASTALFELVAACNKKYTGNHSQRATLRNAGGGA